MARRAILSAAFWAMLGLLGLAACTAEGENPAPTASPSAASALSSVDPSDLYSSDSPPAVGGSKEPQVPASSPELLPVVSEDDTVPLGEIGQLVPMIGSVLSGTTPEQQLVIDTARYMQVKKCMADRGFTLVDAPPELEVPDRLAIPFDAYIGILDADYAAQFGYQTDPRTVAGTPVSHPEYPSAEYELALGGGTDPDGGCRGEADRLVEQGRLSEDDSTPLLGRIFENSLTATWADDNYKNALAQWVSCMGEAGFEYATPLEAFEAFDGFILTDATPNPSAMEVNTAVQDVECKRSSRLADVFRRVFWDHQVAMAEQNRPTLKVLENNIDTLLRNAQRMIESIGER